MSTSTPGSQARPFKGRARAPTATCRTCGTDGKVKTSALIVNHTRRFYYYCPNPECGEEWTAHLEFIKTTTPSRLRCDPALKPD